MMSYEIFKDGIADDQLFSQVLIKRTTKRNCMHSLDQTLNMNQNLSQRKRT